MSDDSHAAADWYPDEHTDGTRYWDGERWTSYARPPRRTFAAESSHKVWGTLLFLVGAASLVLGVLSFWMPQISLWSLFQDEPDGTFDIVVEALTPRRVNFWQALATFAVGLACAMVFATPGVYLIRGRGPTTRFVKDRLAPQHWTQPQEPQQTKKSAKALHWVWRNLTNGGRAWQAYQRGEHTFEAKLRIDSSSYQRVVRDIEEQGWIYKSRTVHAAERTTTVTPKSDGTHHVVRSSTQHATFYFVRDEG